jgi:hypothetical protein
MTFPHGKVLIRNSVCDTCAFNKKSTPDEERRGILQDVLMNPNSVLQCHHGRALICHGFYKFTSKLKVVPDILEEHINRYGMEFVDPGPDMTKQEALEFLQEAFNDFYAKRLYLEDTPPPFSCTIGIEMLGTKFVLASSPGWFGASQVALKHYQNHLEEE